MKKLLLALPIVFLITALVSAQDLNKVVFGPLVGDEAGILGGGHPGDAIDVEMWVRTDPDNDTYIVGVNHSLMSEDEIIAERNGAQLDPQYDMPNWENTFTDGPFTHNPDDNYPIPEGFTSESTVGLYYMFEDPVGDPLDTGGEWDYYGSFHMVTSLEAPGDIAYPFSAGWYPHSENGTDWAFENPPGGSVIPDQDFCALDLSTGINDEKDNLPAEFSIDQNYPNPFNSTTTIRYSLPEKREVAIEIFNILGRKIETLISGIQPAGSHSVVWVAENQPSGVYFYRINAGEYAESKSCLLLK